jgi:hypothetical protein
MKASQRIKLDCKSCGRVSTASKPFLVKRRYEWQCAECGAIHRLYNQKQTVLDPELSFPARLKRLISRSTDLLQQIDQLCFTFRPGGPLSIEKNRLNARYWDLKRRYTDPDPGRSVLNMEVDEYYLLRILKKDDKTLDTALAGG